MQIRNFICVRHKLEKVKGSSLLKFRTTSSFPVPIDTVHRQTMGISRVSRVSSVRIRVRFSFSGANLQETQH